MIHEQGCFITSYTLANYCRVCEAIRSTRTTALDAARAAVAALSFDPLNRDQGPAATQRHAIAAIDALKEKQ